MINISNNLDLKNKQSKTNSHLIKHITRELEHYQNKNIHTELDKVEGMTFEQIQEYTDSRKEKGMNWQKTTTDVYCFVVKLNSLEVNGFLDTNPTPEELKEATEGYKTLLEQYLPEHKILTIATHHEKGVDLHFVVSTFNETTKKWKAKDINPLKLKQLKTDEVKMLKGLKLWHYAPNPKTTPAIESIDKYKEQMEKDKNHILSAIAIKNYKEADKRLEEFKKRYKVKEFNVSSSQPTKAIKEQSINKAR